MPESAPLIEYRGNCHCGAFKFTFKATELKLAFACDCSICSKVRSGLRCSAHICCVWVPPSEMSAGVEWFCDDCCRANAGGNSRKS
ncbi:hypothetical protein DFH09DRAFT_417963 [Mycena vulgaris]|nr:hypothetical protein DFH09DRAFT_604034 [Mycena vulgaris]KAJ6570652.1 hypothetical protein DFH09DRAFT_417963 [Mycena vulgaris]